MEKGWSWIILRISEYYLLHVHFISIYLFIIYRIYTLPYIPSGTSRQLTIKVHNDKINNH